MNGSQTVLTALGCAGSLAAMLVVSSPAVASPAQTSMTFNLDDGLPTLTQADSNPITDALGCGCARCVLGDMQPSL